MMQTTDIIIISLLFSFLVFICSYYGGFSKGYASKEKEIQEAATKARAAEMRKRQQQLAKERTIKQWI